MVTPPDTGTWIAALYFSLPELSINLNMVRKERENPISCQKKGEILPAWK